MFKNQKILLGLSIAIVLGATYWFSRAQDYIIPTFDFDNSAWTPTTPSGSSSSSSSSSSTSSGTFTATPPAGFSVPEGAIGVSTTNKGYVYCLKSSTHLSSLLALTTSGGSDIIRDYPTVKELNADKTLKEVEVGKTTVYSSYPHFGYIFPNKMLHGASSLPASCLTSSQTISSSTSSSTVTTGGCSTIPAGARQVIVDKTTYALQYYDTKETIEGTTGKSGVSYLYMKKPTTGEAWYDYIIGNVCKSTKEQTLGYVYSDKVEKFRAEIAAKATAGTIPVEWCSVIPAGARQVNYDKTTYAVTDYTTNESIADIAGRSGASYLYMKNPATGEGDYNYIVGDICSKFSYIYVDKVDKFRAEFKAKAEAEKAAAAAAAAEKAKQEELAKQAAVEKKEPLATDQSKTKEETTRPETKTETLKETSKESPKTIESPKKEEKKTETVTKVDKDETESIYPADYGEEEEEVVEEEEENPFSDTDLETLEGQAAAELYNQAIIGGYPDGTFRGERPVNRAEAAKFLLLARYGKAETVKYEAKFKDVPKGQWYTNYVLMAAAKGIINGYSDKTFRPANTVNTAEFLKMLNLTFNLEKDLNYSYTDVSAQDWFATYAGVAEKYELFPEKKKKLAPAQSLTRKEVAIAIYQYLTNR